MCDEKLPTHKHACTKKMFRTTRLVNARRGEWLQQKDRSRTGTYLPAMRSLSPDGEGFIFLVLQSRVWCIETYERLQANRTVQHFI